MKQVISKLETGVKSLFGYVGIIMILIETYAVFARNVLKTAAPWTDETLKLLFVWSIFICSGLAFMGDELIGLDLLPEWLSKKPKAYGGIKVIQYVLGLIFGVFTTYWGFNIILTQLSTNETTAVVKYPLWIINLGFFIGSVMITVFALWKIFDSRTYFKGAGMPDRDET
ncbi:MAG: TRAP transporter small permease [Clostridium sp.]|nr:TRAP transporter small permease [Clostridium sp.]